MSESDMSAHEQARKTWGNSPTGTTFATEAEPGTKEFLENVLHNRERIEFPWLRKMLESKRIDKRSVLEVGCGPGYDALLLLQCGAKYTGIDVTVENIYRARKHLQIKGFADFELATGVAEELIFDDATFDLYFSNGVLHHIPKIEKSLSEAYRVLKSNGELFITLYNKRSWFYRLFIERYAYVIKYQRQKELSEILAQIEFNDVGGKPYVRVYEKAEITKLLKDAGFSDISIITRKMSEWDIPHVFPYYLFSDERPAHLPKLMTGLDLSTAFILRHMPQSVYNFLGRFFGWYLVCQARKP